MKSVLGIRIYVVRKKIIKPLPEVQFQILKLLAQVLFRDMRDAFPK
jgi:hypothetical protein